MDKITKIYQRIARQVNPNIKCHRSTTTWCCIPAHNIVYIPRFENNNDLATANCRLSILSALPRANRGLINTLPLELWSFYHELGHIQLQHTANNDKLLRELANFLSKHGDIKNSSKIYYNLKQEKQATQWAVDYIVNNLDTVTKDWEKVEKVTYQTYSKRYKKILDNLAQ